MSELAKRSFLNFLASLAKTGGILALTFIITPILIRLLGEEDFGAYRVLFEIFTYLSLVEMGLLTAVITCMLPLIKGKKEVELKALMAESSRRFYKVVLWTFFFGAIFYPFLPQLTSWEQSDKTQLYITFTILLFTSVVFPSNVYKAYLEASNKGYLVHLIIFFQNICLTLLSVIFAYMGLGLKSQALGLLLSSLFGAFLMRFLSDIKVDKKIKGTSFSGEINSRQKSQVLNELAGKLCWQIDQIVIAALINTSMVTKVFIGQRMAQIIQVQLLSVGQSSWASLSHIYFEENNRELFEKRFYEITKIIAYVAIILLVPVCALNRSFISLWVGKDLLLETDVLIYLASANAFFHGIFSFWGLIITVLGKANLLTKPFWIQALCNVTASLLGTYFFGGVGPILGTLVSYLVIPFFIYPQLLKNHFNLSISKLLSSLILPFLLGVLVLILLIFSGVQLTDLSLKDFAWKSFAIFTVNALMMFLVLFNREEKVILINRINNFKKNWFP